MTRHMNELKQMQSLPLDQKIKLTKQRIKEWYEGWDGMVYVSFSGGKDSTVLLHIARNIYPDIPAVFVDTGLEYPEIKEHVKKFNTVTILRPKMTFRQVLDGCGYPVISKEIAHTIEYAKKTGTKSSDYYLKRLNNEVLTTDGKLSGYNCPKWKFLLDSPFGISSTCCTIMKKTPMHKYAHETGRKAITGQMACESRLRTQKWIQSGCNAFSAKEPISNPMSFWTEQDVLEYIKKYNIPICSIYGDVVEVEGQFSPIYDEDWIELFGIDKTDRPLLKTTGCNRTGCMFCMFGCHLNNDQRFVRMKETHPQIYDYCMKPTSENGLGLKDVIDWMNEHGNLKIKY